MKKIIIFILILIVCIIGFSLYNSHNITQRNKTIANINKHYNKYVKTHENINLYDENQNTIGTLSNIELILEDINIDEKTKYFFVPSLNGYVYFDDVTPIDTISEHDKSYIKYVPFNKKVKLKKNSKIYIDENTTYAFDKEITFNPIILDDEKYYFEYDGKLVYIFKNDIIEEIDSENQNVALKIPVLNYHYVLNSSNPEEIKECKQAICILDTQYEEQLKYLKDNDYYTISMKEFELWMDKKINLPKKSVLITIDDGWYVSRNIELLEKYDLYATLFLIGSLASPNDYKSNNLEIHSHGFNIHNIGECPGGLGGAILCKDRDYLLEDLRKSSESLNNTTYFCYPFYEYNSYSISVLKEANYTMAFKGGNVKATQDDDKFQIPRYRITNGTTLDNFINYVS